ncbi:hypothetical protein ACVWYF_001388 [Hymenobacter sp. UYAg731]
MKKLTLLLSAALLLAGAANAQVRTLTPAAPSAVGANPNPVSQPTSAAGPVTLTGRPALGSTGAINNDSYVQQVGDGQMANVSQTGTGRNTADIDQSPSLANVIVPGADGNYASQTQVSTGSTASGDQNRAYIGQFGATSTAIQEQTGTRNQAAIRQGNKAGNIGFGVLSGNDYASQKQTGNDNKATIAQNTTIGISNNSATQEQKGNGNNASASQEAQNHTSVQKQGGIGGGTGNNNNATVTQRGLNQYASQDQQGNGNLASITQQTLLTANNQALQAQTGDFNRATITQSTSNNVASQMQSGGNSNYAETIQGGNLLRDSAYSMTTQQGSNNTAVVHQGVH